jgi:hypothetical protein
MTDEAERRIEAARVEAQRAKDNADFLASLKTGDSTVRHIQNPEAFVMREKYIGAANRNEFEQSQRDCSHPLAYLQQFVDDDPLMRREGRPVNLFACGVCHLPIWFSDPWGRPLSDD